MLDRFLGDLHAPSFACAGLGRVTRYSVELAFLPFLHCFSKAGNLPPNRPPIADLLDAAGIRDWRAVTLALSLPESFRLVILCKNMLDDIASHHAQGGIAAAWSVEDDIENHVADTLEAGAGLCDEAVVRTILSQGK